MDIETKKEREKENPREMGTEERKEKINRREVARF